MADSSTDSDGKNPIEGVPRTDSNSSPVGDARPVRAGAPGDIPRGIEVLVKKASVDPAFREVLLEKRALAANEIELELSSAERAMLNAVPAAQIEQIIENVTVPDEQRRIFLGKIGAAMLAAVGFDLINVGHASGLVPYERKILRRSSRGILPDDPVSRDNRPGRPTQLPVGLGIRPTARRPGKIVFVSPEGSGKRLHSRIRETGPDSVLVTVRYDCPYDRGVLAIFFRQDTERAGAMIWSYPRVFQIEKNSGLVRFSAEGNPGRTEWLFMMLRNQAEQCRGVDASSNWWPRGPYKPGEYRFDDCVIWSVVKFHKKWSSNK